MTPAARLAAVIELLDQILLNARDEGASADVLIANYFRRRRYAGSKDRAAIREIVYDVVRHAEISVPSGREAVLAYAQCYKPDMLVLFGIDRYGPMALSEDEQDYASQAEGPWVPDWLEAAFERQFGLNWPLERAVFLERAPLDLRVNSLKATSGEQVRAMLGSDGIKASTIPGLPWALRCERGSAIERSQAYRDGFIEIQDAASQVFLKVADAKPNSLIVDYCAGAGGKTLGLAAAMENSGRLIACDIDIRRLDRMTPRLVRAGVQNVEVRCLQENNMDDLVGQADLVVVDAPCSGTGTWRRNPESRFRLTPSRLNNLQKMQDQVLHSAARLVRPGGSLVYGVCSVLLEEGNERIQAFLEQESQFKIRKPMQNVMHVQRKYTLMGQVLSPYHDNMDGFFVANMERICD